MDDGVEFLHRFCCSSSSSSFSSSFFAKVEPARSSTLHWNDRWSFTVEKYCCLSEDTWFVLVELMRWSLLDPPCLSTTSSTRTSTLHRCHSVEQQVLSSPYCPSRCMFFLFLLRRLLRLLLFLFELTNTSSERSAWSTMLAISRSLSLPYSCSYATHLGEHGGTSSSFHACTHCQRTRARCTSGNEHVIKKKTKKKGISWFFSSSSSSSSSSKVYPRFLLVFSLAPINLHFSLPLPFTEWSSRSLVSTLTCWFIVKKTSPRDRLLVYAKRPHCRRSYRTDSFSFCLLLSRCLSLRLCFIWLFFNCVSSTASVSLEKELHHENREKKNEDCFHLLLFRVRCCLLGSLLRKRKRKKKKKRETEKGRKNRRERQEKENRDISMRARARTHTHTREQAQWSAVVMLFFTHLLLLWLFLFAFHEMQAVNTAASSFCCLFG